MVVESGLPLLAVVIPVAAVLIIPWLNDAQGNWFTALAAAASLVVILMMYPQIHAGDTLVKVYDTGAIVKIAFMADSLSFLVGLVSIVLWMLASIYGVGYMHKEHAQGRYNIVSLLSLAGMLGVVFTKNLFSLFIFFELLSVASYVMVVHTESPEAKSAGLTYIAMGIVGGLFLLVSVVATYAITGSGDLSGVATGLAGHPLTPYIFLGYIIGFGVKAGIFPVHVWLPTAHPVAPAPASALLSGVMIKAGAYGIIRTVYGITGSSLLSDLPMGKTLLVIAVITMFLGSFMAIVQTDIKRLLAYSSIAQMGYIILGVALLSPLGLVGAVIHIFHHAFMKGTLFLCAGAFIHQTGLRKVGDLRGIGRRMPLTMACFTMAGLSMIGVPPFVGFISKWYLALGGLESETMGVLGSGGGVWIIGFLLLSSLLNALYYGPIIFRGWFGAPGEDEDTSMQGRKSDDPRWVMLAPLLLLAIGTLVFGIFPQLQVGLAEAVKRLYF
jgi:multicomponent Na+:H+ antiporter subunit D